MARFSSVAYEDPPNTTNTVLAGTEQFLDKYGVSITRPILEYKVEKHSNSPNEGVEDLWGMAHVDAISPRPLMLMLSECNLSGISDHDAAAMAKSQFQWEALATNKKTSTQFDVWRITSPVEEMHKTSSASKNILVVAFRGTRLSSYVDLLTDIQLKQDMISCSEFGVCMDGWDDVFNSGTNDEANVGGSKHESNTPKSSISQSSNNDTLMAHSGFLRAYSSIRSNLLQLLSDNAGTYDYIWFTGHSLGAALATLAVVDVGSLMTNSPQAITIKSMQSTSSTPLIREIILPKVKVSSYLFGTPRVGNHSFADRLNQLQLQPDTVIPEYYRINTVGDAVVFLPRGKVVNRLDIDYVHAGASVFLPALYADDGDDDMNDGDVSNEEKAHARRRKTNESYNQWMMQLEEDTIGQINQRIFQNDENVASRNKQPANQNGANANSHEKDNISTKIRIYPKGDQPPDPLSEIDPEYSGFFPTDPRTWISSTAFQNFLLGETVRSFRILRGGFVKNHKLQSYEDGLCLSSQDNVRLINNPLT